MRFSRSAHPKPFRYASPLLRLVAVAVLLTQTAGGCFNTDQTCADLGKVPTCNVGAQAGTAGTAGAGGSGTGGDSPGGAGPAEAGGAGDGGARN